MTKRRGRGEGAIYKKAENVWCAQLTTGYDGNATRKRRYVYGKTKADVQKKLLELQTALSSGSLADPKRMRVADYLKHWLEDVARPAVRAGTYVNYEMLIRNHIAPYIGGIQLASLQPSHIQNMYSRLEKDGKSPRTREHAHATLRRALSQAVRWGYMQRNVCDIVDKPRVAKKPMNCLTAEQARSLIEAAVDDRFYALYILALSTGMRMGELFGLQWSDIDLHTGALSVQRTAGELRGKIEIGEPKTAKGRRKIELPRMAVEALRKHRQQTLSEGLFLEWVFCDTTGNILRKSNFRKRSYLPLLKKVNIQKLRFHDLRHTAATLLLSKGVHPKIVQERLGHAQIGVTLDTYSHVLPSMQKEAAAILDIMFKNERLAAVRLHRPKKPLIPSLEAYVTS